MFHSKAKLISFSLPDRNGKRESLFSPFPTNRLINHKHWYIHQVRNRKIFGHWINQFAPDIGRIGSADKYLYSLSGDQAIAVAFFTRIWTNRESAKQMLFFSRLSRMKPKFPFREPLTTKTISSSCNKGY